MENHPTLLGYLGDIARLHSRFEEALSWYREAEERYRVRGELHDVGRALRGQARVYLDTVNPSQAEQLLQKALRLSEGQEDRESRARLLDLLAENLVNRGRLDEAEKYRQQASELREEGPAEAELDMRLLLRTGRLDEARRRLMERAETEREEPILRPRAHRETLLLLSLILSFQGEREAAFQCAVEGTERGRALSSHFITAVGHMRQGHAWLLDKDEIGYQEAGRCFQEAVALSERLDVPRLKVEAFWGLCQAYGFRGDLERAQEVANQGIALAQKAGDEWVEANIRLVMGAGYALTERHGDASTWLAQASTAFRECADTHGETVARLWQCLVWQDAGDGTRLTRDVADLLSLVQQYNYQFLFLKKTLLGPPEPRSLVPLLLFARDKGKYGVYAESLLANLGLAGIFNHPGYQLRVQTLGHFRVWRATHEVGVREWRRKKARQLFQLLLTYRGKMLDRDQIVEHLWPELEPEDAQRDLKTALSALSNVLEPKRSRNSPSAYVVREGSLYGLRSSSDIWLDAEQFQSLVAQAEALISDQDIEALDKYRQALALYQGDYLPERAYEDWSSEERERLLTLYLQSAERLAERLAEKGLWEKVENVFKGYLLKDFAQWKNRKRDNRLKVNLHSWIKRIEVFCTWAQINPFDGT